MVNGIELDYIAGCDIMHLRHIENARHVCCLNREFIERAYAALQAKLKEEEEAKTIKDGDWVVCTSKYTLNCPSHNAIHSVGQITQVSPTWHGFNNDGYYLQYWRKLTAEEVSRLPNP